MGEPKPNTIEKRHSSAAKTPPHEKQREAAEAGGRETSYGNWARPTAKSCEGAKNTRSATGSAARTKPWKTPPRESKTEDGRKQAEKAMGDGGSRAKNHHSHGQARTAEER